MEVWKGKGDRKERCSEKQRGLKAGKKGLLWKREFWKGEQDWKLD